MCKKTTSVVLIICLFIILMVAPVSAGVIHVSSWHTQSVGEDPVAWIVYKDMPDEISIVEDPNGGEGTCLRLYDAGNGQYYKPFMYKHDIFSEDIPYVIEADWYLPSSSKDLIGGMVYFVIESIKGSHCQVGVKFVLEDNKITSYNNSGNISIVYDQWNKIRIRTDASSEGENGTFDVTVIQGSETDEITDVPFYPYWQDGGYYPFNRLLIQSPAHPPEGEALTACFNHVKVTEDIPSPVQITITSIREQVEDYVASGDLGNPLYKQLKNSLKQAEFHKTAGRDDQAVKHLKNSLKHLVDKAMERFITEEAKGELESMVSYLIDVWENEGKDLNPVTYKKTPSHPPVALVEDGLAKGAISVLVDDPSEALALAIQELQECILQTTGALIPIVYGQIEKPGIIIGDSEEAANLGLTGEQMPHEGFAIRTDDEAVFIVGNGDGTAWGIFEFLERFVNVRWYWPTNRGGRSIIPDPDLIINPVWLEDSPVYRMRTTWPPAATGPDGTYQVLKEHDIILRMGSSWPVELTVHTPRWNNVEEIKNQLPEVFQLREDGTRDYQMICYSNPLTLETYLEEISRVFDDGHPVNINRMGIKGDTITVSPADTGITCHCQECRALWDSDAGREGAASKIMVNFVDRLAREVKNRWPDKKVMYLPYSNYILAPEEHEFPDNVHVQVCGMRPGIAQYKEPSILAFEQENFERWAATTSNKITTWHYSCWPADKTKAPYQYPHVLKDYFQHNRDIMAGAFNNGTGDLWPRFHISLYAWYKLIWDPDFDVDAAINEYCRRMYGPAADTIRELVELEIEGWENSRWPDAALSPKVIYEYSYPPEVVERMKDLLVQARSELTGNWQGLARLDYFEIPFSDFLKEYESVVYGIEARPLIIQKVYEEPLVDGRLDDNVWQETDTAFLVKHDTSQGEVPVDFPTEVKSLWTNYGLYFGMKMDEPNTDQLVKDITNHDDSMLWHQDCVEIFLDVTGENIGEFYQFIISAGNTVWDARNGSSAWDIEGMQSEIFIGEDFWSIEVFIPVSAFQEIESMRTMEWYGQLTRHRAQTGKTVPGDENQKLNATFGGMNANLADFAPFIFSE